MGLNQIRGHTEALNLLQKIKTQDMGSFSLLFHGPPGVGKFTTALHFAQEINCTAQNSCGQCVPCRKYTRFFQATAEEEYTVPDLMVINEGRKKISLDSIKELVAATAFHNFEMRKRCLIINEAHNLTLPAANALLKVLEEPPLHNVFILVSDQPEALLPTIRSRCLKIKLNYLRAPEINDILQQRLGYSEQESKLYLQVNNSSLEHVEEILNNNIIERLITFIENYLLKGLDSNIVNFSEELIREDVDLTRFLDYLALFFHDCLKQTWRNEPWLNITKKYLSELNIAPLQTANCLEHIQTAKYELACQGNKHLVMENLFLNMQAVLGPSAD